MCAAGACTRIHASGVELSKQAVRTDAGTPGPGKALSPTLRTAIGPRSILCVVAPAPGWARLAALRPRAATARTRSPPPWLAAAARGCGLTVAASRGPPLSRAPHAQARRLLGVAVGGTWRRRRGLCGAGAGQATRPRTGPACGARTLRPHGHAVQASGPSNSLGAFHTATQKPCPRALACP